VFWCGSCVSCIWVFCVLHVVFVSCGVVCESEKSFLCVCDLCVLCVVWFVVCVWKWKCFLCAVVVLLCVSVVVLLCVFVAVCRMWCYMCGVFRTVLFLKAKNVFCVWCCVWFVCSVVCIGVWKWKCFLCVVVLLLCVCVCVVRCALLCGYIVVLLCVRMVVCTRWCCRVEFVVFSRIFHSTRMFRK